MGIEIKSYSMRSNQTTLQIPLSAIKPVWRDDDAGTLLVELPIAALRGDNEPQTLDDIIAQARIDYARGDFKSFTNVDDLIHDLKT